jgi:hypothetical protein
MADTWMNFCMASIKFFSDRKTIVLTLIFSGQNSVHSLRVTVWKAFGQQKPSTRSKLE